MANKVYAVKEGKKIGIFNTWEECKEVVVGYPGAEYKGFKSLDDAKAYLSGKLVTSNKEERKMIVSPTTSDVVHIYYSCKIDATVTKIGVVLNTKEGITKYKGLYESTDNAYTTRVYLVLLCLQLALSKGYKKVCIYTNLQECKKWATGEWHIKSEIAKEYKNYFYIMSMNYNNPEITFLLNTEYVSNTFIKETDAIIKNKLILPNTAITKEQIQKHNVLECDFVKLS